MSTRFRVVILPYLEIENATIGVPFGSIFGVATLGDSWCTPLGVGFKMLGGVLIL